MILIYAKVQCLAIEESAIHVNFTNEDDVRSSLEDDIFQIENSDSFSDNEEESSQEVEFSQNIHFDTSDEFSSENKESSKEEDITDTSDELFSDNEEESSQEVEVTNYDNSDESSSSEDDYISVFELLEKRKKTSDENYQKINEFELAEYLDGLLSDTKVNYLVIRSKPERGNLVKITDGTFKKLSELVELEVRNHKVNEISIDAFEHNVNLMKIDFSDNEITGLNPDLFKNLLQLREVNFQQNRLKSLSENLFDKNLELSSINFARNEIQEIPVKLFDKLENLEEIVLNDNRIKVISGQIYKETNLDELRISDKKTAKNEASEEINDEEEGNSGQNLVIDLSNNELDSIPVNIIRVRKSIELLRLTNNSIENLNSDYFLNIKIDTLVFSNNKIVKIPHDFPDNFQKIYLNDNNIRKISDSIYKNKNTLEELHLSGNQIDEILVSEETDDRPNLLYFKILKIDLSANNLHELKPYTFASIKPNLNINLSENNLKRLPENLFSGSNVLELNFAYNLIEKLESDSFKNAQLNVFRADFSNNKIKMLDDDLFDKWGRLLELNLSHNRIEFLPEKLFGNQIKSTLKTVSFADNKINKIDNNTFVNCTWLQNIDLKNNTCFDVAFDSNRNEHEICSNNCEGSCFIVNIYHPIVSISEAAGIFVGSQICEAGKKFIRNDCRFVRKSS
jgi:Leucine-rich repeat (LRR) protein